jgi:hypothetical protein
MHRDLSTDNARGAVVLLVIYFHYYECWHPNCRIRPVERLATLRTLSADWPRAGLYMFQSLIIVSAISRSREKKQFFPWRLVIFYFSWFVFEVFVSHVFRISGNSFAPSWFLLDVIFGQTFTIIADALGLSKWLSSGILFALTVATYVYFPEMRFTSSFWQKLDGQFSPRTMAHTFIFILSSWCSQDLIRLRERIQRSHAIKVTFSAALAFACCHSIYTTGDIKCSVLFATERFSLWTSKRKERCQQEIWFYSLFSGVLSSITIVMISPSSPVPLITWLGQRSLVPYIGHMYFVNNGLKVLVDKLFQHMSPLGISALHTTIPILLNIVLSCFNFVLVPRTLKKCAPHSFLKRQSLQDV